MMFTCLFCLAVFCSVVGWEGEPEISDCAHENINELSGCGGRIEPIRGETQEEKATGRGRVTARQIEAARRAMTRHIKRGGKIWIRVFPDKPITGKPLEVRQGKGKGNVEYWVAQVQPGKVLYEVQGVSEELAREAFELAAAKIPVATTFVKRSVM